MIRLSLHVHWEIRSRFTPLLEKGVVLTADTGCSLRSFLCGQLGLSETYLERRIQTLFLDFRPVDDVDRAIVRDGSTIALSAAMPGLLGATMRKGGRYAAFRKGISQQADTCGMGNKSGRVTVKLFNMVATEVGGILLQRGVEVEGRDLVRIFQRQDTLLSGVRKAVVDDRETRIDQSFLDKLPGNRVWFSLMAQPPETKEGS